MQLLPDDVMAYRRTPIFSESSVPSALQGPHNTKAGVWAIIHVLEGEILYRVLDPDAFEEVMLSSDQPGIIVPEQLHQVEVRGPVRFFVEFHAADKKTAKPCHTTTFPVEAVR